MTYSRMLVARVRGGLQSRIRCFSWTVDKQYWNDRHDENESRFNKVLIANRGEIAVRVIRSCQRLGIKTVAIHSDADAHSVHVKLADEAVCVGTAQVKDSYLRIDNILKALKQTGADAVHPGYGFLSENAAFSQMLQDRNITFVGPSGESIKAMGDKIQSKRIAKEANVNCIPGYDGDDITSVEEALEVANDVGYPVMVKASAGGGGKGMRIAWNDKELVEGYRLSKDEAKSSFGDDRMLIEKFIDEPRHIEVQVLCDKHGNGIYLNERECSIQRRNQKVIEEAPSTFLDEKTRAAMGAQAVALAQAVKYSSAGTVEFLVDSKRNFYFLEMNTRLQVEHPITELITGVDLVHQMLRVAKGHKLLHSQRDISIKGWAVESRVYAEDPYKQFGLPSIGRLHGYREPTYLPGVRCDSGIDEGSQISIYYDPMICKLVTYGDNRDDALLTMRKALDEYVIRGVTHNIPLLRDIITEKRFVDGDLTTNYLPETYPDGFQGKQLNEIEAHHLDVLTCTIYRHMVRSQTTFIDEKCVNDPPESERLSLLTDDPLDDAKIFDVALANELRDVTMKKKVLPTWLVRDCDDSVTQVELLPSATTNSHAINVRITDGFNSEKRSTYNYVVQVYDHAPTGHIQLQFLGTVFKRRVLPQRVAMLLCHVPVKSAADLAKFVQAPMPGLIKSVNVRVGDKVAANQELCVLEAMKMQNSLVAQCDGVVKAIGVAVGETVSDGDTIIELE